MYQYTDFDRQFITARAAQYRDQLERNLAGTLADDDFRPLRLQNGWYIQRYAPMLRIAVPYGELATRQLRVLARIAREYDQPDAALLQEAHDTQAKLGDIRLSNGKVLGSALGYGYGHFTTRTNTQFNWVPLVKSAEVMELLASVSMHGIQTSGNCIRNITSDELSGIAQDEIADPRPFGEIMRQWSTLHPEFAFLPRKFKIAISGATEDRAATPWYDVGLQVVRDEALAERETGPLAGVGFQVRVGGGMGRTPIIGSVVREFLPWHQVMNYLEAVIRVYNRYGRRDNVWKARIKILVKAEGQRYIDQVEAEYRQIVDVDGGPHTITQAEYDRVAACFVVPELTRHVGAPLAALPHGDKAFDRWLARNVAAHKNPNLRAVTLSFKRPGANPGDASAEVMEAAADLADQYSASELRLTHQQNLLLPWVHVNDLPALYAEAKRLGLAQSNIGLLTDMIVCPGGDFCSLANARSLPIAQALTERYQDMDELHDLGPIDLNMSGCINSCGHHHSGHIGILGVDKDGKEWYQVTLGGADGSAHSGPALAGKVVGPSFSAAEVPDVVEAVLATYKELRQSHGARTESFIETLRRTGIEPFKQAANAARHPAQALETEAA
ncbi:nitrite/sulfite reductase [Candidatus Aalborgicola defluviihabitans]|uniref:nitrite/sulfite reductase n=1 Tax=Candidatus Aalborgicola defluviihabitans TaxID=3386187 RepID=UPI001ECE5D71|nr:nitrite/sulfite reductase [Burkholderiales bacterium]